MGQLTFIDVQRILRVSAFLEHIPMILNPHSPMCCWAQSSPYSTFQFVMSGQNENTPVIPAYLNEHK